MYLLFGAICWFRWLRDLVAFNIALVKGGKLYPYIAIRSSQDMHHETNYVSQYALLCIVPYHMLCFTKVSATNKLMPLNSRHYMYHDAFCNVTPVSQYVLYHSWAYYTTSICFKKDFQKFSCNSKDSWTDTNAQSLEVSAILHVGAAKELSGPVNTT